MTAVDDHRPASASPAMPLAVPTEWPVDIGVLDIVAGMLEDVDAMSDQERAAVAKLRAAATEATKAVHAARWRHPQLALDGELLGDSLYPS